MKCPNCGKKMKKSTCAKCGYDPAKVETPAAPVTPATPVVPTYQPTVSYYTFDPANPNVWYPMATNAQGQPVIVNPTTQIQFAPTIATAPQVMPTATTAVQQPVQQSATQTTETDDLATAVGKRAEKIAKKLAKKAEKKMTKGQKKAAKTVLNAMDKAEEKLPKNVASRLFAILLIAACVFTFGFLQVYAVTGSEQVSQGNMLAIIQKMFQADETLFGVLPAFISKDGSGTAYNLSVYIFALFGVFAFLSALFAAFSKQKAPKRVRRALFFLGAGALDYTISMSALIGTGNNMFLNDEILATLDLFNLGGYQVEMLLMVIGSACLVLSFLFLIFRRRNKVTD